MKKYEEAIIEIEKFYTESIMEESQPTIEEPSLGPDDLGWT